LGSHPKSHQTTIRFSKELWGRLEEAAAELDVSIAHYVRDAATARLDASPAPRQDQLPPGLGHELDVARSTSRERILDSTAVWEQARQARLRATQLRAEAATQRGRHSREQGSVGGVVSGMEV